MVPLVCLWLFLLLSFLLLCPWSAFVFKQILLLEQWRWLQLGGISCIFSFCFLLILCPYALIFQQFVRWWKCRLSVMFLSVSYFLFFAGMSAKMKAMAGLCVYEFFFCVFCSGFLGFFYLCLFFGFLGFCSYSLLSLFSGLYFALPFIRPESLPLNQSCLCRSVIPPRMGLWAEDVVTIGSVLLLIF